MILMNKRLPQLSQVFSVHMFMFSSVPKKQVKRQFLASLVSWTPSHHKDAMISFITGSFEWPQKNNSNEFIYFYHTAFNIVFSYASSCSVATGL